MSQKQKIIQETIKLFSIKGYMNTSIMDIMQAAHVSKGGFYNHFSSKEALFLDVVSAARKIWRKDVLRGVAETEDPLRKLALVIENYSFNYLRNYSCIPGGCIFITLSVELDDQSPRLYYEIKRGFDGFRRILHGWLEEAQKLGRIDSSTDVTAAAEMVFSTMLGASVIYGGDRSAEKLDLTFNCLTNYINSITLKHQSP